MQLPLPLRAVNRMPTSAARRVASLDPDSIVAAAAKKAEVDGFAVAPDVGDGLAALTDSLERDARLTPFGRMGMRASLVDALVARAGVLDWHRRESAIADEAVEAPIAIIGLPRTGTTLLSFLLQQDTRWRTPRHWEAMDPSPPPTLVEDTTDDRVKAAEKQLSGLWKIAPGFRAIHPMEPAGPAECVTITAQAMASMQYETQAYMPGYGDWMDAADFGPSFAYHRQVLQLLQWRSPGERWNLKTPAYLLTLDALLDTYPDAKLIWTHRDPADVVTSVASLNSALHSIMSDEVDPELIGPHWLERLGTLVDRAMTTFSRRTPAAIAHIDYRALVASPVETVTAAYEELGLEMTDLARRRMQAWMDANPQSRWGRHRYDPAEFALGEDQIRDRFTPYRDQYDLP